MNWRSCVERRYEETKRDTEDVKPSLQRRILARRSRGQPALSELESHRGKPGNCPQLADRARALPRRDEVCQTARDAETAVKAAKRDGKLVQFQKRDKPAARCGTEFFQNLRPE